MAVLGDVDDHCLPPAEQEVAHASTGCHSDAEVGIVGHEDKHQEVADDHLNNVQHGLYEVGWAQHPLSARTRDDVSAAVSILALAF